VSQRDARDVVQEVSARTSEQLGKLRDDAAFRAWLGQLTRRLCIDKLRANSREQPTDELEPRGVDNTLAELDEAMTVHDGLATLSENCQEILDRFFTRDESYRTIGE